MLFSAWFLGCHTPAESDPSNDAFQPSGLSHYDEVTYAWCQDIAIQNLRKVPGNTLRASGGPSGAAGDPRLEALYALLKPVCGCVVAQGARRFNAFYAHSGAVADMFDGGSEGLAEQLIVPTNFGALFGDHLGACAHTLDDAALRALLYRADEPTFCQADATGATGNRLGRHAALEALFTIDERRQYGPRLENGCRGGARVRYDCDDHGVLDAAIAPCAQGCDDGCDAPDPPVEPPPDYGPVLSGPVCAEAGCAAPGPTTLPALPVPHCDGSSLDPAAASCGAPATVLYYYSAWCPLCVQHLPHLVEMFEHELAGVGARLIVAVGRDGGWHPPTRHYCEAVTERFGLDAAQVVYDPTGGLLDALDGSSGGGVMVLADGAGQVRYQATSGGSLLALRSALDEVLTGECSR